MTKRQEIAERRRTRILEVLEEEGPSTGYHIARALGTACEATVSRDMTSLELSGRARRRAGAWELTAAPSKARGSARPDPGPGDLDAPKRTCEACGETKPRHVFVKGSFTCVRCAWGGTASP